MKTTIIIPHKHGKMNDQCLELNLIMLKENTTIQYDVIIDDGPEDPYLIWNKQTAKIDSDVVIFTNTDVLFAPEWDIMVKYAVPNSIVTGYLVECNAIGVHRTNIPMNFGQKPETFRRKDFEEFAKKHAQLVPEIKEERGWYMPCALDRKWFVSTGGFDMSRGSFSVEPLDIYFWEECLKNPDFKLFRAKSYAYHFQNLSNETRCQRK